MGSVSATAVADWTAEPPLSGRRGGIGGDSRSTGSSGGAPSTRSTATATGIGATLAPVAMTSITTRASPVNCRTLVLGWMTIATSRGPPSLIWRTSITWLSAIALVIVVSAMAARSNRATTVSPIRSIS